MFALFAASIDECLYQHEPSVYYNMFEDGENKVSYRYSMSSSYVANAPLNTLSDQRKV